MKKIITTLSIMAGLVCGNAMATTSSELLSALDTCSANQSCPQPTGFVFPDERTAKQFLGQVKLAGMKIVKLNAIVVIVPTAEMITMSSQVEQ